jgi:ubiquinone/menaquinone biosynthesis C-methylase UbiE
LENPTAEKLYAQLYDLRVPDWDGEVDFYQNLIGTSNLKQQGVLEIACGTGRIAMRLASKGIEITGLDNSPELLEIARGKSIGLSNVLWVLGDMRTFDIGKKFGWVISPGHSFQAMTTPDDQVMCLEQMKRHLVPGGLAVLHIDYQDIEWLAGLARQKEPNYEKSSLLTQPISNQNFRYSAAWSYESSTQTATVTTLIEELDEAGEVIQIWEMEPRRMHCIFPFEMEHLLRRVGFSIQAVYGDFFKSKLTSASGQMIWLVKNQTSPQTA